MSETFIEKFTPSEHIPDQGKTQYLIKEVRPLTEDEIYTHFSAVADPEVVRGMGFSMATAYDVIGHSEAGEVKGTRWKIEGPCLAIQQTGYEKLLFRYPRKTNDGAALPSKVLATPKFNWNVCVRLDHYQEMYRKATEGTATEQKQHSQKLISRINRYGETQYKFQKVIIAAGDRDAANIASLGYDVVWMNQERVLPQYVIHALGLIFHDIFILYDADRTGREKVHENCLEYLHMYRMDLPEVPHQRGVKDMTDFCQAWAKEPSHAPMVKSLFREMLNRARPYAIYRWKISVNKDQNFRKAEPEIVKDFIGPFLTHNGFFWVKDENDVTWLAHRLGNVVHPVSKGQARRWLTQFFEKKGIEHQVREAIKRSPYVTQSIDEDVPIIDDLEVGRGYSDHQVLVFPHDVWHVYSDAIKSYKQGKTDDLVLKAQVINPAVKYLPLEVRAPFFKITQDRSGQYDIEVTNEDSYILRMLMCQSYVHWRSAFKKAGVDERLPLTWDELIEKGLHPLKSKYLTQDELAEQKLHLVNKIHSGGYSLWTYKDMSNAFWPFDTDYQVGLNKESNGRTAKTLWTTFLWSFVTHEDVNARDREVFNRPHVFGNTTKRTEALGVNDAGAYTNYDFLFDYIQGTMLVNPKNQPQRAIAFDDSPKGRINSNFVPINCDPSTLDRFQFSLFADFFNAGRPDTPARRPGLFFNKTFITGWTPEEWVTEINLAAQCIQVAMRFRRIDPPMEHIFKRNAQAKIGDELKKWLDTNFLPLVNDDQGMGSVPVVEDPDSVEAYPQPVVDEWHARTIKNRIWINSTAFCDMWNKQGHRKMSSTAFNEAVEQWAKVAHGFVFNPEDFWDKGRKAPLKPFKIGMETRNCQAFFISKEKMAKVKFDEQSDYLNMSKP